MSPGEPLINAVNYPALEKPTPAPATDEEGQPTLDEDGRPILGLAKLPMMQTPRPARTDHQKIEWLYNQLARHDVQEALGVRPGAAAWQMMLADLQLVARNVARFDELVRIAYPRGGASLSEYLFSGVEGQKRYTGNPEELANIVPREEGETDHDWMQRAAYLATAVLSFLPDNLGMIERGVDYALAYRAGELPPAEDDQGEGDDAEDHEDQPEHGNPLERDPGTAGHSELDDQGEDGEGDAERLEASTLPPVHGLDRNGEDGEEEGDDLHSHGGTPSPSSPD